MDRDENDTGRLRQRRLADLVRRPQAPQVRVRAGRSSRPAATNALTSFGMIVGLLIVWAMAVGM